MLKNLGKKGNPLAYKAFSSLSIRKQPQMSKVIWKALDKREFDWMADKSE